MKILRRVLDLLYSAAGVIAALCLIAILSLIVAQMIARWTGTIEPGQTSNLQVCMQDLMATMADLTGQPKPRASDGISYLPTLTGEGEQVRHEYLAWEFHGYGGQLALIDFPWKIVRQDVKTKKPGEWQLYNLQDDPSESNDLAAKHPDIVAKMDKTFRNDRQSNARNKLPLFD